MRFFKLMLCFLLVPFLVIGQNAKLDSLKGALNNFTPDRSRVEIWLSIHDILKLSNFREAATYADSAYTLALTSDSPDLKARTGQFHATALSLTSRFEEAKIVLGITIENARIINDKKIEAYAFMTLGNVAYDLSDFAEALPHYQRSKELYLEINNFTGASSALIWIGIVNQNALKNFPRAITIYKEAAELAEQGNSTLNLGYIQNNLGNLYYQVEEIDSAITYIESSNAIKRQFNDKRGLANGLELLADCYVEKEQFRKSLLLYDETLELRYALGDSIGLANSYINMGRVYGLTGTYEKALTFIQKGRGIALRVGHRENLPQSFEYESEFLEKSKNFAGALNSYKSFKNTSDSLFNVTSQRVLEEMQVKYDTEGKERRIELQTVELDGQEAKLQRNQVLIIGLIAVAILLIIIVVLVRNRAQKDKMLIKREGELRLREAEINAVIGSQEKERNRFARDLHDGFGQMISVLKMNLGQLGNGASKNPEKQLEVFEQSEKVISDMYTELRNICFDLMPQTLVQLGLPDALKEFGHRVSDTGTKVLEVLIFDMDERLDELTEVSLYRISQEWVNNVLKYSGADHITLQLTRDEEELTLTIEDNGAGFDPEDFFNGKGNGWRNVQTRVNLIKGEFVLDSRPGVKGSMVSVNVPVALLKEIPTSTDKQITV